jgi:hypothetical protein
MAELQFALDSDTAEGIKVEYFVHKK